MTKSKNAVFELGTHIGQPFLEGGKSIGKVTVTKSTKLWIKYRKFDRSISHGKVKRCVLPGGKASFYVEVGQFNSITPAAHSPSAQGAKKPPPPGGSKKPAKIP